MDDRLSGGHTTDQKWNSLYIIGGASALIAGALFLIAAVDLLISVLWPDAIHGWLLPFQDNWLIVIFKLHAGFSGAQLDQLSVLNILDIAILALVGFAVLGLFAALRKASKAWSIIALVQPFLGIILFMATKSAGRSGVMGAVLVISFVMLRDQFFKRWIAFMGLLASVVLLIGDFSAGIVHSTLIAVLFGVGYLILISWLFLIGRGLFKISNVTQNRIGST